MPGSLFNTPPVTTLHWQFVAIDQAVRMKRIELRLKQALRLGDKGYDAERLIQATLVELQWARLLPVRLYDAFGWIARMEQEPSDWGATLLVTDEKNLALATHDLDRVSLPGQTPPVTFKATHWKLVKLPGQY